MDNNKITMYNMMNKRVSVGVGGAGTGVSKHKNLPSTSTSNDTSLTKAERYSQLVTLNRIVHELTSPVSLNRIKTDFLFVSRDTTINGNIYVGQQTTLIGNVIIATTQQSIDPTTNAPVVGSNDCWVVAIITFPIKVV